MEGPPNAPVQFYFFSIFAALSLRSKKHSTSGAAVRTFFFVFWRSRQHMIRIAESFFLRQGIAVAIAPLPLLFGRMMCQPATSSSSVRVGLSQSEELSPNPRRTTNKGEMTNERYCLNLTFFRRCCLLLPGTRDVFFACIQNVQNVHVLLFLASK